MCGYSVQTTCTMQRHLMAARAQSSKARRHRGDRAATRSCQNEGRIKQRPEPTNMMSAWVNLYPGRCELRCRATSGCLPFVFKSRGAASEHKQTHRKPINRFAQTYSNWYLLGDRSPHCRPAHCISTHTEVYPSVNRGSRTRHRLQARGSVPHSHSLSSSARLRARTPKTKTTSSSWPGAHARLASNGRFF